MNIEFCRLCYNEGKEDFIKPCSCIYKVHSKCLYNWRKNNPNSLYQCEFCLDYYFYEKQDKWFKYKTMSKLILTFLLYQSFSLLLGMILTGFGSSIPNISIDLHLYQYLLGIFITNLFTAIIIYFKWTPITYSKIYNFLLLITVGIYIFIYQQCYRDLILHKTIKDLSL